MWKIKELFPVTHGGMLKKESLLGELFEDVWGLLCGDAMF